MEKYFHNLSVSIIRFIPRNKSIFMFKNVVVDSFDKAEKDILGKTTKTSISEHLSEALLNDFRVQISGRTLRNLLDESNKLTSEKEDIVINSEYVQALCKYLGYEDYDSF